LSYGISKVINWTWAGANPDHWIVQESADGVSGWVNHNIYAGEVRTGLVSAYSIYARLIGYDPAGGQLTDPSNVVYSM
jgi:hypothetical protein